MKRTHPDSQSPHKRLWLSAGRQLTALICGCLVSSAVLALPEDRDKPMNITADEGTYRSGSGRSHFAGNVHLKQGTLELWADTLDVIRDPETGEIEFLEAHGQPARYQELPEADGELIRVRGLRIEYRPDEDIIITEGEGEVDRAGNEIQGHYIEYNLVDESLRVRSRRAETNNTDAPQATWTLQPGALD